MEETFQEVRAAPKVLDTEAMVGEEGHPTHRPGAVESFSVVTLLAHQRMQQRVASNVRRSAWYNEGSSNLLRRFGAGRQAVVDADALCGSSSDTDTVKARRELLNRLTDAVCYAV